MRYISKFEKKRVSKRICYLIRKQIIEILKIFVMDNAVLKL
jgi:hypothetical protein